MTRDAFLKELREKQKVVFEKGEVDAQFYVQADHAASTLSRLLAPGEIVRSGLQLGKPLTRVPAPIEENSGEGESTWWLVTDRAVIRFNLTASVKERQAHTTTTWRRWPLESLLWWELTEVHDDPPQFTLRLFFADRSEESVDSFQLAPGRGNTREAVLHLAAALLPAATEEK